MIITGTGNTRPGQTKKHERGPPKSTSKCLVFPYHKSTMKFQTKIYSSIEPSLAYPSQEEVEKFLEEISGPLAAWEAKFGDLDRFRGKYLWYFVLFILLLPLLLCYFFWLFAEQSHAETELKEVREKTRALISQKSDLFSEKGLSWSVPELYPMWIELRNFGGSFQRNDTEEAPQEGVHVIEIQAKT